MDTSGLADMYTQNPIKDTGLRAEGINIRQTTSGHFTTYVTYVPQPLLLTNTKQLIIIE